VQTKSLRRLVKADVFKLHQQKRATTCFGQFPERAVYQRQFLFGCRGVLG
jgi:hypothetical protein